MEVSRELMEEGWRTSGNKWRMDGGPWEQMEEGWRTNGNKWRKDGGLAGTNGGRLED